MSQPFFPLSDNLEYQLMHRDNLKVEQLSMLLDFLTQICYVDVTTKQPFIKQDAFEGEILFGQSQFQYLLHQ